MSILKAQGSSFCKYVSPHIILVVLVGTIIEELAEAPLRKLALELQTLKADTCPQQHYPIRRHDYWNKKEARLGHLHRLYNNILQTGLVGFRHGIPLIHIDLTSPRFSWRLRMCVLAPSSLPP